MYMNFVGKKYVCPFRELAICIFSLLHHFFKLSPYDWKILEWANKLQKKTKKKQTNKNSSAETHPPTVNTFMSNN